MSAGEGELRAVHVGDGVFVAVATGGDRDAAPPPVPTGPAPRRWHVPAGSLVPAAAIALVALARVGASPRGLMEAGLLAVLVVLSAIDLRWRLLPNRIVVPATAIALVAQLAISPSGVPGALAAGVGAAVILLLPNLLSSSAIGMGDVKLAALLGVALGPGVLAALVVGSLAMGAAAVAVLLRHGAAGRQATIPLGPFLAFGAAVTVLA
jgi:leader peptidase (prepilin peptidase)/N-methyltransferase